MINTPQPTPQVTSTPFNVSSTPQNVTATPTPAQQSSSMTTTTPQSIEEERKIEEEIVLLEKSLTDIDDKIKKAINAVQKGRLEIKKTSIVTQIDSKRKKLTQMRGTMQ